MKQNSRPKDAAKPAHGGISGVAEMLNVMEPALRDRLLGEMTKRDPVLAQKVVEQMFRFEDIARFEGAPLQTFLRSVPVKKLALALRKTTDEMKNWVFSNLPQRYGDLLREEMDQMGPQKVSDVQAAQAEIVALARQAEAQGTLGPRRQ